MLAQKIVALLIMVIPAAIAGFGIKLMRDVCYLYFDPDIHTFLWGQFSIGFILFTLPVAFIAGFILHHDRKRNRVQPRFMTPEEDDE
ncbi:DUF2627 domain-containing protein [Brevibacillus ginsengisoli]|uniref:DUF2627 domain-containing protein n=1 Tax=Brevibacillus ginsengisoli TaxID=363854 RepID=UPI003CE6DDD7